jgi:DNA-binding MarR family transcriptional regulator
VKASPVADSASLLPSESTSSSWLLVQSYHLLRARIEAALKPCGLTGLQLTILSMLKNCSDMSSADLARRYYKTPQGMGQLLSALAERALITRTEHPENRRILQMSLTAAGRKALVTGEAAMHGVERQTFAHLDEETLQIMRTALHEVGKNSLTASKRKTFPA